MKTIYTLLIITFFIVSCKGKTQNIKSTIQQPAIFQQKKDTLSVLIDSLYQVDQKVQNDVIEAFQNGITGDSIKILFSNIPLVYQRHIPILKNIVKENGYPTVKLVGQESSHHFFIMVQHSDADVEFQNKMLKLISPEIDNGNVSGKERLFGWEWRKYS